MFRILFTICAILIFAIQEVSAQEVLWANKVLEKSSETIDEKFSPKHRAIQILGAPSVLPQTVSSACSWRPAGVSFGEDYIKVGFEKAIKVKQIIIGETVGQGAVGRIFGYTESGTELLLFQNDGRNPRKRPGIWNEMIPETAEEIVAVKLVIVHSLNKGIKEYDCIGISSSTEPFIAKINVADDLPEDLQKINLGPNINSKYSEVAPLVSPDGKYLYFTRLNHPKNHSMVLSKKGTVTEDDANLDVWVSRLNQAGEWEEASNMDKPIHEGSKNAAATIAMSGQSIFALNVKRPDGSYEAGLTKVTLRNNKWVERRRVFIDNFEALSYYNQIDRRPKKETEFAMSSDEKILIMGLVRRETYGDKDLYVSFKTGENTYSKPLNLGPKINTAGNEGSPFLASDNKTLYFNSNGHPGYGDMDIFMTTRLDDTWSNWSTPVNLGPQINSAEFDGYISIPASGEFAFFSSAKNSLGLDDIFKVRLFPGIQPEPVALLEFKFTDFETGKNLFPETKIAEVENVNSGNIEFFFNEESKTFKAVLPLGRKYQITAISEEHNPFLKEIDLRYSKEYEEITADYVLQKPSLKISEENEELVKTAETVPPVTEETSIDNINIQEGEKLILSDVYFDQSKADLSEESFRVLNKIRDLMNQYPQMEILLEGHTDNQGDAALNFKLAEDRVNNVRKYILQDSGISPNRISIKSWGQYRPLVNNSTEDGRVKNRRVEFTIIKL